MRSKLLLRPVIAGFLAFVAATMAGDDGKKEILVHQGPEFTTPGLGPKEELKFIKEFPVDPAVWEKQPQVSFRSEKLPLSAEKAIELAKASAEAGDGPGEKNLIRLELLRHGGDGGADGRAGICYYFVELNVEGSEVHRVVLMDGTVVKSRLRQLKDK